jgi:pimeloyl-ACP methyl ester carboxylesterase
MRTELISIATDTLPLDGALHLPDGEPVSGAVMLFHGNTMNFYVGAPRFLPPVLTQLGFACLAFNRRGHDILSIRDSRAAEGAAFQLTREGIEDNNYAADWLARRGYTSPVVIGHSNGGACLRSSMCPTVRRRLPWSCYPRMAAGATAYSVPPGPA